MKKWPVVIEATYREPITVEPDGSFVSMSVCEGYDQASVNIHPKDVDRLIEALALAKADAIEAIALEQGETQ